MNLLRYFYKSTEAVSAIVQEERSDDGFPIYHTEQELMEKYGAASLEKQNELATLIGSNSWSIDITKGEISFGANISFPIQVLGTFSKYTNKWLWSWANIYSDLPTGITIQSGLLKKYGEAYQIDLLRRPEFEAYQYDLHLMGLIASGMFGANGYYLADFGQGILLVTLKGEGAESQVKTNPFSIDTIFSQFISLFDLNHKNALRHYLSLKGYRITEAGKQLVGTKNGNVVKATFNDLLKLTTISG